VLGRGTPDEAEPPEHDVIDLTEPEPEPAREAAE
jgi:hypothetical protein